MKNHYVSVQSRGTIAIPAELRRRLQLDRPGAQVKLIERDDGSVELQSVLPIAAEQAWFWADRWQAMEHEVDAHVAANEVTTHEDADALFNYLERRSNE